MDPLITENGHSESWEGRDSKGRRSEKAYIVKTTHLTFC